MALIPTPDIPDARGTYVHRPDTVEAVRYLPTKLGEMPNVFSWLDTYPAYSATWSQNLGKGLAGNPFVAVKEHVELFDPDSKGSWTVYPGYWLVATDHDTVRPMMNDEFQKLYMSEHEHDIFVFEARSQ